MVHSVAAPAKDDRLTIDELARRTGLTARNIRAYQTRGLLPPPEIQGRTGFYGPEHEARIRAIRELQESGFNLGAIRRLLEAGAAGGEEALRLGTALLVPWRTEEPEEMDADELARRFRTVDPVAIERAEELGILTALPDGRFRVESPTLLRAGEQVVSLGVPVREALAVMEEVTHHADAVAKAFVTLFLDNVWKPFQDAGRPPGEWARVRGAVERLSPLASSVLVTAFRRRMAEEVQAAVGEELVGDGQAPR